MDQFTKEGRKLRPRKTVGPRPASEKVEYTPGAHHSESGEQRNSYYGDRKPRPYGENRQGGYGHRDNGGYSSRGGSYGGHSGNSYGSRRSDDGERRPYGEGRSNFSGNREGGYGRREGGYGNREGGYSNREGGSSNREGGYSNREGGYSNREGGYSDRKPRQYGDRPLLYGNPYSAPVAMKVQGEYYVPVAEEGAPEYQRVEKRDSTEPDRYELIGHKQKYVYTYNMLFPRMYSDRHAKAYEDWMGGIKGNTVEIERAGERHQIKVPTFFENIYFFMSYQVNFMYWRYFMWNFSGRQNDIQGNGELEHGNWLTGIPFIDNMRLGDQSLLPTELKNNKGHNVFYALPLILGLIGFFWQVN